MDIIMVQVYSENHLRMGQATELLWLSVARCRKVSGAWATMSQDIRKYVLLCPFKRSNKTFTA
jgi:hypothetical protein